MLLQKSHLFAAAVSAAAKKAFCPRRAGRPFARALAHAPATMAKGTTPKRATRASTKAKGGHEPWMDDEVDEHHRSRDKISLDPEADSSDDDDEFDDEGAGAVMDIKADSSDEDDSDEDDDDSDEDDDEDDDENDVPERKVVDELDDDDDVEEDAALLRAMRAQQRRLDAKGATRRTADDDDLEASESDSDDETAGIRGSKKDDFYGDDDVDHEGQSDSEDRRDEELEARRLQRRAADGMETGDFEAFSDSDGSDPEERTLGAKAKKASREGAKKDSAKPNGDGKTKHAFREGAVLESLGAEAVIAAASDAVASDAPELIALTKELIKNLDEVRGSVEPVIAAARAGELATAEGISYLDAKHLLMLSYCINIVFYLLLKSEGRPVRDHPVVLRLVEIRAYLEKLRPIDRKLKYQIDKLLKMADGKKESAAADDDDDDDPLRFKPNPDALVGKADEEDAGDAGGAYRPPKMVPTSMDELEEGGKSAKQKRKEKEARRRASRSALIKVRRFFGFFFSFCREIFFFFF